MVSNYFDLLSNVVSLLFDSKIMAASDKTGVLFSLSTKLTPLLVILYDEDIMVTVICEIQLNFIHMYLFYIVILVSLTILFILQLQILTSLIGQFVVMRCHYNLIFDH